MKEVSVTAPVTTLLHLGAHEGRALAGLDVLELHDLHDLAVHLKGLAVSEITGGNSCHIDIPPILMREHHDSLEYMIPAEIWPRIFYMISTCLARVSGEKSCLLLAIFPAPAAFHGAL